MKKLDEKNIDIEIAEKQKFIDELKFIVGLVSRKKVDVITQLPHGVNKKDENEWFRSTQVDRITGKVVKEFVYLPPEMFVIPQNEAKGKAAHEGGHVAITRHGQFVPDVVVKEVGFSSMLSSLEERPTDQIVRKTFPGAGEWLDEARLGSLRESLKYAEKLDVERGIVPKFAQFQNIVVFGRYIDDLLNIDGDVQELYAALQYEIEKFEAMIPEMNSSEGERIEFAKQRYIQAFKKIWPEVQKLVEEDKENAELSKMASDAIKNEGEQGSKTDSKTQESQGEQTDQPTKEDIQKALESMLDGIDGVDELGDELENLAEDILKNMQKKDDEGGDTKGIPIPMDKVPEKLKEALKKAFDKMSEDDKQSIKSDVKKDLKDIEDDLVDMVQSGINGKNELSTHEEIEQKEVEEEVEREKEKKQREVKKAMDELDEKLNKLRNDKSVYDKTYEKVREYEEDLYQSLEEIFNPNLKKNVRLKSAGSRINLSAVYRRAAQIGGGAPVVDNKVFETVNIPNKHEYAITLMVDLSGSMRGDRIEETFNGVVLLTETLNRLGVKIEVVGFQDELIDFKDFDDDLNDGIREKMSGMIKEVTGDNPNGHNEYGYNDDGPCLDDAYKKISSRDEREKFIFVLSDGLPEGRRSDSYDLDNAISKIKSNGDVKLVGVGLGSRTDHVKKFYGKTALPNIEVKDLPEVLGGLLLDIVQNPHKFQ